MHLNRGSLSLYVIDLYLLGVHVFVGGHFSELGTRDIDGVGANNYDEPSTPLRGIAK